MTRLEVMEQLHEPVEVHLVSDIEKREVSVDIHGRRSLQNESTFRRRVVFGLQNSL